MSIVHWLGLVMLIFPGSAVLIWVIYESIKKKDWQTLVFLGTITWVMIAFMLIISD